MKKFSDFAQEDTAFTGDKIQIEKLLNIPIIVYDYRIKESKFKKGSSDKCLTIQFSYTENQNPF